jgi:hypothetical protein
MQKISAGRSPGRSVSTELEMLRLLALQRRRASLRLFLKRNVQLQAPARTDKATVRAMVAGSVPNRRSVQARLG